MINTCILCDNFTWDLVFNEGEGLFVIKYYCTKQRNPKGELSFFVNNNLPVGDGNYTKIKDPSRLFLNDSTYKNKLITPNRLVLLFGGYIPTAEDCPTYRERLFDSMFGFKEGCGYNLCELCNNLIVEARILKGYHLEYQTLYTLKCKDGNIKPKYCVRIRDTDSMLSISEIKALELIDTDEKIRFSNETKTTIIDRISTSLRNIFS